MKTDSPIHVHRNGVTEGPFSLHELFENLSKGVLSDTDQVWDEDANEWVLIRDVFPRKGHEEGRSVPLPQPTISGKPSAYKSVRLGFVLTTI
jgi:hypothetical protein